MAGIKELRYIKRTNLGHEQNLMKQYFREIVHSYGADVKYFRKYLDFYRTPSGNVDYTYGEDPCAEYFLSGDMVVYMEMMGDAFLLSKFGIETDGDAAVYFTIDDFNLKFVDEIGIPVTGQFQTEVFGEFNNYSGIVSGITSNDDICGVISGTYSVEPSGTTMLNFSSPLYVLQQAVNPDIKRPTYYNYDREASGTINGPLSVHLDLSGNGYSSGFVNGLVYYRSKPAELAGPGWTDISPQAGDFFRLDFDGENQEEYKITRVHDRNLQTDGLNPLLGKYIWRCDCVRRDPSYEIVIGDLQEEKDTTSKIEQNKWHEDVSNEIFDYDNEVVDEYDGVNSDSVYGDY